MAGVTVTKAILYNNNNKAILYNRPYLGLHSK
jgi:hypothetical protein